MTTFDLSRLVHDVHDSTDLTDHEQVAKEVLSRIPKADLEEALLVALTEYVRSRFTGRRLNGEATVTRPRSAKVEGIRQWWQRSQNQRYDTIDGQKLLRDFTLEDCLYQAAQDRRQAKALEAKAEQWDELAALLELNRVATVSDLP